MTMPAELSGLSGLPGAALHMGALHPVELVLVILLAFGPFIALALVVVIQRRRDEEQDVCSEDGREDVSSDDGRERL